MSAAETEPEEEDKNKVYEAVAEPEEEDKGKVCEEVDGTKEAKDKESVVAVAPNNVPDEEWTEIKRKPKKKGNK